MHCVILAAGSSTRLRPLTESTPKCLLEVNSISILERMLTSLTALPIQRFTVVIGFEGAKIHEFVRDKFERLPVTFIENNEYASTNNAYSLLLAQDAVVDDEMILLDSDILFDKRILPLLLTSPYPNALALRTNGAFGPEEIKVQCNSSNGRISKIGKNIDISSASGESIGIEKFSSQATSKLFSILHKRIVLEKRITEYYEASFQEMIDNSGAIHAVNLGNFQCLEIDTPEDLVTAKIMFP
jgi:choline kinase